MNKKYKLIILLLLAAFLSMNGCAYYNYLYNANNNFKHGMDAKQVANSAPGTGKADFDKVIDGCATMLEFYPDSRWAPEALILMAKAYYESDQYSKSLRKCLELENNYPTSKFIPEAKLCKAKCWLALKQTKEGRDLLLVLESEPDITVQYNARLLLADALMADSLFPQALEQYNGMEGKAPNKELEASTTQEKLECLLKLKRYDDAILTIDKLLKYKLLRPKQHEYRIRRAQLWNKTGHADKAIADLTKLYKDGSFRNQRDSTKVELGVAYFTAGDTAKALSYWNDILENDKIHNDITSEAAYYRGNYRFATHQEDSLITQDWTRSSHDRAGGAFAVLADTANAHFIWKKAITARYESARAQYDVLLDLMNGKPVPDSIRNRYLANMRPVPSSNDTANATSTEIEQKPPNRGRRPNASDTTKKGLSQVSKLTGEVSKKPETVDTTAHVSIAPPEKQIVPTDTVKTNEIQADTLTRFGPPAIGTLTVKKDSIQNVVGDTLATIKDTTKIVTQDTTKLSTSDTTLASKITHADSLLDTTKMGLDTAPIVTAIADAEKDLVRIVDEKKEEAFYRKDSTAALGYYPELLALTKKRAHSAYQLEYAVMSRSVGDSIRSDSLYRIVASDSIHVPIANAARKALNMDLLPEPVDTSNMMLRGAEWILDAFQDTTTALKVYESIAKKDTVHLSEKANAAIAILNINRVPTDSLEKLFDHLSKIAKIPKNVAFARQMVSYIQETRRADSLMAILKANIIRIDTIKVTFDSLVVTYDSASGKNDTIKIQLTKLAPDTIWKVAKVDTSKITVDSLVVKYDSLSGKYDTTKIQVTRAIPDSLRKALVVDTTKAVHDTTGIHNGSTVAKPDTTHILAPPDTGKVITPPDTTKLKSNEKGIKPDTTHLQIPVDTSNTTVPPSPATLPAGHD